MDYYDIYAIYHQHLITNTNYYCNLTQIISQHKIPILYTVYYNITYASTKIFIVILAYHTTLAYLRLQIVSLFSSKCNDDVLFLG